MILPKKRHTKYRSVSKSVAFLPSPLPSPHEEREEIKYIHFAQSLPLGRDLEGQTSKIAMQFHEAMKNTVIQMVDVLNFLKIAENCKKLQHIEEMLRQAQHDKRLPRRFAPRNDGNTYPPLPLRRRGFARLITYSIFLTPYASNFITFVA